MICYDLKTLQKAYCSGESCRFLFFWGHTPPADGHMNESCLSQWWMSLMSRIGVGDPESNSDGVYERAPAEYR